MEDIEENKKSKNDYEKICEGLTGHVSEEHQLFECESEHIIEPEENEESKKK